MNHLTGMHDSGTTGSRLISANYIRTIEIIGRICWPLVVQLYNEKTPVARSSSGSIHLFRKPVPAPRLSDLIIGYFATYPLGHESQKIQGPNTRSFASDSNFPLFCHYFRKSASICICSRYCKHASPTLPFKRSNNRVLRFSSLKTRDQASLQSCT
jgi:hypothetical protein